MNNNSELSCQVPKRSCFYIDLLVTTHPVPHPICPLVPEARVSPGYSRLLREAHVLPRSPWMSACLTNGHSSPSPQHPDVARAPSPLILSPWQMALRWLCEKMLSARTPAQNPSPLSLPSPGAESRLPDRLPDPVHRKSLPSGPLGFVCHLDPFSPPQSIRHSLRTSKFQGERQEVSLILLSCEYPGTVSILFTWRDNVLISFTSCLTPAGIGCQV